MKLAAAIENPFELFSPAYAQRALLCVIVLALLSAAVGWAIVLRDLPFFTHAIGSGAYPVLVAAVILGVSAALAAIAGALVFAALLALATGIGTARAAKSDPGLRDAQVGLAVVAALAIGTVIAAVGATGNARLGVSAESLLFGSVLTVGGSTLAALVVVTVIAGACSLLLFDRWLAAGFDTGVSENLGSQRTDIALLGCVALAAGAALPVTGALLAGAMLIVPAATAQLVTGRARRLPLVTLMFALTYGVLGLYVSVAFDLPTGAAIAATAGAGFFLVASVRALARSASLRSPAPAFAASLLAAFVVAGCGGGANSSEPAANEKLAVVASTPQVADIAKSVGGEAVEITTLLPPGADPHDFEPKPSAIAALGEADVIFLSGGDLDSWIEPALDSASPKNPPIDLSQSAVLIEGGGHGEDDHGSEHGHDKGAQFNSHWYLAPANVSRATQRVRDVLVKADPPSRETFRANANAYLDEIEAVDKGLQTCAAKLSKEQRRLVSGHDDFAYLADAFGLEITAQLAETGESQPSASDLQKSIDQARSAGAKALVASSGEVSELEQQVAKKLDVPLLQLYADNLTTGDDASTVLGAIGYDVDRIVNAVSQGEIKCPATQ